jgi:cell wall-associated NlpC family hydrolase
MFLLKTNPMRLLLLLAGISVLGASCSTVKKASVPAANQQRKTTSATASPVFIENISFTPGQENSKPASFGSAQDKSFNSKEPAVMPVYTNSGNTGSSIESTSSLRFKYAILLDAPVEEMNDAKLLEFMEDWYGTRYRLGGNDKSGIDCSAFVQSFFAAIYGLTISRTCREQYVETNRIKKSHLKEGDLVFFKTKGKSISHVGVYLRNNKFIHASTSSGVMISDLDEEYFQQRYAGAGRF